MNPHELSHKLKQSSKYINIEKVIKAKREAIVLLTKEDAELEKQRGKELQPLLDACKSKSERDYNTVCPETYGTRGYCDGCSCKYICPSTKKDWTE